MKYFKKLLWVGVLINFILLVYVLTQFSVDDMTLSRGEVSTFNEGWKIIREDGSGMQLAALPYLGESEPDEVVIIENTIPKEFLGQTMSFLSADKVLRVRIDGSIVYEFGTNDSRTFGRTPGSVIHFIDIPNNLEHGKISMEMISPYSDYAASINEITVGARDVLILKLLQDNAFSILSCTMILVCGIGFAVLFCAHKVSKQDTEGVQYVCGYCLVAAVYYFIETKTLSIFYGNQTLYSILIFLCLMFMPFWLMLYYGSSKLGIYKKRWIILLSIICANFGFQLVLQLFNIFDFMEMAFVSHAILAMAILVTGVSYFHLYLQERDKSIFVEMVAWFFMGAGGFIDIIRMYLIGVGDMGKYSRLGSTAFCIIMLYKHYRKVLRGYSGSIKENARLLQEQMHYMEKKTRQLENANALAEEARAQALAADAAKGKFLAHMSHEIRTPINAVLGMNTMILRETTDMQIKEYALDIQNAGHNLLALINDILDFSKIESGKLEIVCVEYDLSSMIHDISNMIIAKVRDKGLQFDIHIDEELPSKLLGDDVRVRQILVNLLNNAVKYTHEGTVQLSIKGQCQNGKVMLVCSVEDTGIGIREEDISKLFKEFERIEEKRNRNIEGTGLGINITMQLLSLMGSSLQVESEYGKGSKFSFSLEQQIVDSTPVGNLEERLKQQSVEYSYLEVFTAPDAQILVVDDNAMNLKVFINLLKTTKVNVDVADGGYACLDMVCKKRYDLIFLDHMMPDLDGIETLHRMKELEESMCSNTPVIALTANAITGAKEMYLAEGFDAFLSKPINPEKLEQMILLLLPRELLIFDVVEQEDNEKTSQKQHENIQVKADADNLPMVDGIDWSYGLLHLRDEELLLDTVKDFYKAIFPEADALEGFYEELNGVDALQMLNSYRIKVHAMKSSANMIGATVLGGMAKLLESAAKSADMELIQTMTPIFLKEWRSYKEKLEICIPKSDEKIEILDNSLVLAYLEILRVAMLEMDLDGMDNSMAELEKFQYAEKIQSKIEQLSVFVTEMDEKQAVTLIEELMELIKQ